MNNKKFIINNRTKLNDSEVFQYIASVLEQGLISNNNTEYCYISKFYSGVVVETTKTSYGYKILVYEEIGGQ